MAGHGHERTRARCRRTPGRSRALAGPAPRRAPPRATRWPRRRASTAATATRTSSDDEHRRRDRTAGRAQVERASDEQRPRRSARRARPGRRRAPRRPPRRPRPTSPTVAAVPDAAVHVAEHAAGQRRVEELRAVVGGERAPATGARRRAAPATSRQRHAQHTVVTSGDDRTRPTSARPSVARSPSTNGPAPSARRRARRGSRRRPAARPAPPRCVDADSDGVDLRAWRGRHADRSYGRRGRRVHARPSGRHAGEHAATAALSRPSRQRRPPRPGRRRSRARRAGSPSQRRSAAARAPGRPAAPAGRAAARRRRGRAPRARRRRRVAEHRQAAGQRLGDDHAVGLGARGEDEQVGRRRRRRRARRRRAGPVKPHPVAEPDGRGPRRAAGRRTPGRRSSGPTQRAAPRQVARRRPAPSSSTSWPLAGVTAPTQSSAGRRRRPGASARRVDAGLGDVRPGPGRARRCSRSHSPGPAAGRHHGGARRSARPRASRRPGARPGRRRRAACARARRAAAGRPPGTSTSGAARRDQPVEQHEPRRRACRPGRPRARPRDGRVGHAASRRRRPCSCTAQPSAASPSQTRRS